jgi:hypothetical protein
MEIGLYSGIGLIVFCVVVAYHHDKERKKLLGLLKKELASGASGTGLVEMMDIHLERSFNWVNTVVLGGMLLILCIAVWPVVLIMLLVAKRYD